ncbi:MAG: FAD-binding oxidoreductase [Chloroflexi bacterium]|nr:FAD-binding protein [Chloroflexota bacterium]MQC26728.1 FAD-binding oxidoreductase [Chloroflexota bacterium]
MSAERLEHLAHELGRRIAGEVRLDAASRKLYSTDASIYQIEPLGVVIPREEDDLVATLSLAAEYEIPILPRGSGTSLAGQTVGEALVIDCSRHLNNILEINTEERYAWVQPGVVLDRFNRMAAPRGFKYGPDPASEDRASFGGMLGNNSTGAHSILYGMSSDNVLEMDVVLSDGTQARLAEVPLDEARRRAARDDLEGRLYARALALRTDYAEAIRRTWPRSWRRASGYSLNYLLPWAPSQPPMWDQKANGAYPPVRPDSLNLAPLLVGSEGTLAVTSRAKIRIVPRAPQTVLGVLNFESIAAACDATPGLLELSPSAVELIPQAMIRLARAVPAYAEKLSFVHGDPAALLVVEFSGDDPNELKRQLKRLGPKAVLALSAEEQNQIWSVRKVALGLLMSRPGDSKPLPFIEDVAVPVEQLGEFVRGLERIFAAHGTHGDFYAHASAGCLHVRPLVNLKTLSGIQQMRAITEEVVQLANRFGGAMSGEHGDGLARSEWLEATFGPEIMAAFRALKSTADPHNILNPGKLIDAPSMDQNLRFGDGYKTQAWIPVFDFATQGGLAGAIEMCNGAGVCRKDHGVMCPSFQATREEMHSTRGRANLLRAMISSPTVDSATESQAHAALDLCLECKGCKAECPSAVDVAKLKYEFLHRYYSTHRRPLRDYLFVNLDRLGRFAQPIAPLANTLIGNPISAWLAQAFLGFSAKRGLPKFRPPVSDLQSQASGLPPSDVLLLNDPFTEFFYPEVKQAALKLLAAAGLRPQVIPVLGAGRPLISKGFLPEAQRHAEKLLNAIHQLDPEGRLPVVGLEPSELYTLKDEYLELLPESAPAQALAQRAWMLEEFLLRPGPNDKSPAETLSAQPGGRVLLHGHCYQKAQPPAADGFPIGQQATAHLLEALGWEVEIVDSGCCGMAGSFGYEAEHYDLSMQVGELALFPALRAATPDQIVVAPGISCRTQIASGSDREAQHPITLIADQLIT